MQDYDPVEWSNSLLQPISDATAFPVDQLKFVLFLLISYPLGYLHLRMLSGELIRHLYSILVGLTFLFYSFGFVGMFHFFLSSFLVYGFVIVLGPKNAPYVGFGVMMSYLSALHIYRQINDYGGWKMDVTSVVMVATIKLSALCCNYSDGHRPVDQLFESYWKEYAVRQWPSVLEYTSFLCYFPTFLTGPAFHLETYRKYINGSLFKHEKFNPDGSLPAGQKTAGISAFVSAVLCIVAHIGLSMYFKVDNLYTEGGLTGNLLWRLVYVHCALSAKRCTYYFAWKLSEGAGIFAGMGFAGWTSDGKPKWDGINNIGVLQCEFPENVRALTVWWNVKTSEWLRYYVYTRTQKDKTSKPPSYAMLLTNMCSAFWHGFYPGYYLAFGLASFNIEEARILRGLFRKYFVNADGSAKSYKIFYDIGATFLALLTFDTGFGMFNGLSINSALTLNNQIYWSTIIGSILVYPVLLFLNARASRESRKPAASATPKKDE